MNNDAISHPDHYTQGNKCLYIAGPVTGIKNLNIQAFLDAKAELTRAGYEVIIPHDHVPAAATHDEAMAICLPIVREADGIALLDRWLESFGTRQEMNTAWILGKPFKPWKEWL